MRVLFCVRHNFNSAPGGAQIQIINTKKYLEQLGVNCDLTTTPYNVNYNDYDILHLTDLTWVYDNIVYLKQIKKSKFKGKKVLSTIYWPFDDYAKNGAPVFQRLLFKLFGINGFEYAKAFGKFILKRDSIYLQGLIKSYIKNQRKIVNEIDLLLPNAELEMQILNRRLNLNLDNYKVIYNAIDTLNFEKIKTEVNITTNDRLITFVARIDPRKNQLSFLKSMMDNDYVIRFIGNAGPNSYGYLKKLKKLAKKRGNVEFISHVTQNEVFVNMLEAKVNVLTSWVETPGLVSIEAAFANCNIVISDKGSVKEYFGEFAYYCNLNDIKDISNKVSKAMNAPLNNFNFLEKVKKEFSWQKTANDTLIGYKKLLNEL